LLQRAAKRGRAARGVQRSAAVAQEQLEPGDVPSRRLLMFDSLDEMVRVWGANGARGFFTCCCPFLLGTD
jgi:hypothetical protein